MGREALKALKVTHAHCIQTYGKNTKMDSFSKYLLSAYQAPDTEGTAEKKKNNRKTPAFMGHTSAGEITNKKNSKLYTINDDKCCREK